MAETRGGRRKIGVLGGGNVGGNLARLWAATGHTVVVGVPEPDSARSQELSSSAGVSVATNREASADAEVVAVAVPWPAAEAALQEAGNLAGKVVIDCMNPLAADLRSLVIGNATSAAEQVAAWAKGARVVKAFNTIGAMNFGNAQFGNLRADGFYCGDDAAAKALVRGLIEDAGLEPVDVGPLRNARLLEHLALLWIDLAVNQKQGPNHAFKLLRR